MVLRRATMADLGELLDVQQVGAEAGLGHIFPQDAYPFPRSRVREQWAAEIGGAEVQVYVAVGEEGRIVGFAAIRDNELLHFGTALHTWGSGLAGTVHDELVELLAAAGHPSATLLVFEENHRARRFYEKRGWTPTQHRTRSAFPPHPTLMRYELALRRPVGS